MANLSMDESIGPAPTEPLANGTQGIAAAIPQSRAAETGPAAGKTLSPTNPISKPAQVASAKPLEFSLPSATPTSKKERKKEKKLSKLRALEGLGPALEPGKSAKAAKLEQLGSARTMETLFRSSYKTYLDMTGLADNKANIMISVNGLILTIIVASGGSLASSEPMLLIPSAAFMLTCMVSMFFAVLAVRPKIFHRAVTPEDIRADRANILFFDTLTSLQESDYLELMSEILRDPKRTSSHLMKDLYGIGRGLQRKFGLLHKAYTAFLAGLSISIALFIGTSAWIAMAKPATAAEPGAALLGEFAGAQEISAATTLSDGRIVAVGDEKAAPIFLISATADGSFREKAFDAEKLQKIGGVDFAWLDDLEGLDVDADDRVWAITSHSRSSTGDEAGLEIPNREKLVRFEVVGDELANPVVFKDLKRYLVAERPELEDAVAKTDVKNEGGFNIEGLSFDREKRRLQIGLRSPLIGGKAVVLTLDAPNDLFAAGAPHVAEAMDLLDLGGDGIRAMDWNDRLNGYLIVSGPVAKAKVPFKLWLWSGASGDQPREVGVPGKKVLKHVEGVTTVRYHDQEKLLFVADDTPGRWSMVGYELLDLGRP